MALVEMDCFGFQDTHTRVFIKFVYIYIRKIYIKYKNISEKYINKKIYPPSFLGMMRTCNEHTVPYTWNQNEKMNRYHLEDCTRISVSTEHDRYYGQISGHKSKPGA